MLDFNLSRKCSDMFGLNAAIYVVSISSTFFPENHKKISYFRWMKENVISSWIVGTIWWQIWIFLTCPHLQRSTMDDVCNENGGPWGHDQEVTRYSAALIKAQRSQFHFHDTTHTHTQEMWSNVSRAYLSAKKGQRIERKEQWSCTRWTIISFQGLMMVISTS